MTTETYSHLQVLIFYSKLEKIKHSTFKLKVIIIFYFRKIQKYRNSHMTDDI